MKPVPSKKGYRFFKGIPLVVKVLALTLAVSAAVWVVLDYVQNREISEFFIAELDKGLEVQAKENRERFDQYIQSHNQSAKVVVSQQRFQAYVFWSEWQGGENQSIKHHYRLPPWLPSRSIMRAFFHARFAFLIDPGEQVKEVYHHFPEDPPSALLEAGGLLLKMSHDQAYMTNIDGFPWTLTSRSLKDEKGEIISTLMLASPMDEDFLITAHGISSDSEGVAVALVKRETQAIIASNNPDSLSAGMLMDEILKEKYVKAGTSFFDQGASDLDAQFIVLVKTEKARYFADQAISKLKEQRGYLSLALVIAFVLVTLSITWRIRRVTKRIVTFSKENLGIEAHEAGDEIARIFIVAEQLRDGIASSITQANAIAAGDYATKVKVASKYDQLGWALSDMTRTLRQVTTENTKQDWLKTGQTQLHEQIRGEQNILKLAKNIITFLADYLPAQVGLFYVVEDKGKAALCLKLIASHAYSKRKDLVNKYQFGEGLAGQAALEQEYILLTPESENYLQSLPGEDPLENILAMPFFFEHTVKGVIELGFAGEVADERLEFLHLATVNIGIAINSAESRTRLQDLLEQTQNQTEELRSQTEELQSQTEQLQAQQGELRQTNEELEHRSQKMEQQRDAIQKKNRELEESRNVIEKKAEELELSNRYKSEFLANMSHELRTPLNSLLILSQLLANNKDGNLTERQIESARTIYSAGSDLLVLINDVLDMTKVEAGKIEVRAEDVSLDNFTASLTQKFMPVAEKNQLSFEIIREQQLPPVLHTDSLRLMQVINNLLSNALKFTEQGGVTLHIGHPSDGPDLSRSGLDPAQTVAFSVTDTGIGIPEDKREVVFEAFRQADGSTNRKYGGTGLGLSISRQLAHVLGGEIQLRSNDGKGSTFVLYIPEVLSVAGAPVSQTRQEAEKDFSLTKEQIPSRSSEDKPAPPVLKEVHTDEIPDDRNALDSADRSILIIEDDRKLLLVLTDLVREKGFKCIAAEDGRTGLQLAGEYKPAAIILDIGLPDVDGWGVMESLKENPETRHIPVHFMSGADQSMDARKMGAVGYLMKPVSMADFGEAFKKIEHFIQSAVRDLLVVAANDRRKQEIIDLVGNDEIKIVVSESNEETQQHLQKGYFDCLILDIDIEKGEGCSLLQWLHSEEKFWHIPIILYSKRDLTQQEEAILQGCAHDLMVKMVKSPERLLDETTLFLHQVETKLPSEKRKMLRMVHDKETILAHKKVLVADDDMRNTFALVSVLEEKDMEVIVGQNGKEALALLDKHPDTEIVLMDIMMPEMSGYEAMQQIREQTRFSRLPIIALTAKAMKEDKAKCIEAGANDYLSKPVDTHKLLSLIRVWLYR